MSNVIPACVLEAKRKERTERDLGAFFFWLSVPAYAYLDWLRDLAEWTEAATKVSRGGFKALVPADIGEWTY